MLQCCLAGRTAEKHRGRARGQLRGWAAGCEGLWPDRGRGWPVGGSQQVSTVEKNNNRDGDACRNKIDEMGNGSNGDGFVQ